MDLQAEIDKEYPPTHTFRISDLKPTRVLKQRVELISKHFPDFFKGQRLLDVACNKGYFSLSIPDNFKEIIGIDNNKRSIDICNELKKADNIKFIHTSFRNFTTDKQFDKIFIGNAHHHIFKEINGHEWIAKLAAISNGEVLIEGPMDTGCPDIKDYPKHFNDFMEKMEKYFQLTIVVPTVSYTPKRYFMLWKRRNIKNKFYLSIPYIHKQWKRDKYMNNNEIDIFIASISPISNGLFTITDSGWSEEKSDSPIYHYFENEKELFRLHCEHQIYLSKLGYFDVDSATINFFKRDNKLFDKSGVMPISKMENKHIELYFILLNQSYRTISKEIKDKIKAAFETKDAVRIEEAFKWIMNGVQEMKQKEIPH